MMQLDFFPISREQKLEDEVKLLKESLTKLRKSLFARHGEIMGMYSELNNDFENLKKSMCEMKND